MRAKASFTSSGLSGDDDLLGRLEELDASGRPPVLEEDIGPRRRVGERRGIGAGGGVGHFFGGSFRADVTTDAITYERRRVCAISKSGRLRHRF